MGDAKLKIVGDSSKAQDEIIALQKKLEKLDNQMKYVSQRSKRTAKDTSGIWTSTVKMTGGALAGIASMHTALSALTAQAQKYNQVMDQAAQKGQSAAGGIGRLMQMASSDEIRNNLMKQTHAIFQRGAAADLNQAADFVFTMESAQIPKGPERENLIKLAQSRVVSDPANFINALQSMQTAIGKQEAGNYKELADKAFAASGLTKSTAEDVMNAAAGSGGSARALKLSDEQILAAVAITGNAEKSADIGGTQIQNLLTSLQKKGGFEGVSLPDVIRQIQSQGMAPAEQISYFGTIEAKKAFDTLSLNIGEFERAIKLITEAPSRNESQIRIEAANSIPALRAANMRQQAVNAFDLAQQDLGTLRNYREAAQAIIDQAFLEERGPSAFAAKEAFYDSLPAFVQRSDQDFLKNVNVQNQLAESNPELLGEIRSFIGTMERQREAKVTDKSLSVPVDLSSFPKINSYKQAADLIEQDLKARGGFFADQAVNFDRLTTDDEGFINRRLPLQNHPVDRIVRARVEDFLNRGDRESIDLMTRQAAVTTDYAMEPRRMRGGMTPELLGAVTPMAGAVVAASRDYGPEMLQVMRDQTAAMREQTQKMDKLISVTEGNKPPKPEPRRPKAPK